MTERRSETNTLILKKENGLIKVGNSLQITNKILSQSKYQFFGDFNGTLFFEYQLNFDSYVRPALISKIQSLIFIQSDGNVVDINFENSRIKNDKKELFNYLDNSKKEHSFHLPHITNKESDYFSDGIFYLLNKKNHLLIFNYCTYEIKEIVLFENYNSNENDDRFFYNIFTEYKENIITYCNHLFGIDMITTSGRKIPKSKEYIQILDKTTFDIKKSTDVRKYCI